MSNRVPPVLNTILTPLPEKNIIMPLNIISKSYDSFPPMNTPRLQPLNKEIITYPNLRGITYIKDEVDKKKVIIQKEEYSVIYYQIIFFMIIIIIGIILCRFLN